MIDHIGQQLGKYRLVRLLGRGGFAEVYLGEHTRLNTRAHIVAQTYLDPGYSGHASDVWRVQTSLEVVVCSLREQQALDGPFWKGCHTLFGLDKRRLFDLEPLNALLAQLCPLPIPQVLRKGRLEGQPYVVVQCIPGIPLNDFSVLLEEALEELGKALAQIHLRRFSYYGTPTGQRQYPLSTFPARLVEIMHLLVQQFYQADAAIKEMLPAMCEAASRLSSLAWGTLVLIDTDPMQFLTDGARINALVDTEAYAIGPRVFTLTCKLPFCYALPYPGTQRVSQSVNLPN